MLLCLSIGKPESGDSANGPQVGQARVKGLFLLVSRYLQENRVACEMGLYFVLHITKQRNKNALQRLLPALGEQAFIRSSDTLTTDCQGIIFVICRGK